MPYGEIEVNGKELSGPSSKKWKPADKGSALPRHSGIRFHRPQEKAAAAAGPSAQVDNAETEPKSGAAVTAPQSDDGIYSTSTAFIGPLYKPPQQRGGRENSSRGRQKQKLRVQKAEIDSELSQFYKEIEELENEKEDPEGAVKAPGPSEEQHGSRELVKPEEQAVSRALAPPGAARQYAEREPETQPCNGQVMPSVCGVAFPPCRLEWPPLPPFIVPPGPPLPAFNYLNVQRLGAPPNPSDIFHAPVRAPIRDGRYENSCPINWNSLTFDQDGESAECGGQAGRVGFRETSAVLWEDPSPEEHARTDRFPHQPAQEKLDKLQKLLILLRGLPGSGKTTLSRVLLGQSRDGIVFSTDDYFHHQDGYRYNAHQLGEAHDWNQNRAKQAISQGRSPVIIDNTNTQAWEMKPYVEMAIGQGYRVEFHEPETWWKFDPEELEKRNNHGVSRQKIAQMLDRYEYEMSVSIVMNSVEPSHTGPRGSPSRERQRWGDSPDSPAQGCVTNSH